MARKVYARAVQAWNALAAFVERHVLQLLFFTGFAVFYVGVSSLSRPIANVVAGVILMALAAYPYLRVSKR